MSTPQPPTTADAFLRPAPKRLSAMNPRQHALLARHLLDACGGVDEAIDACRVDRTALYNYRNPDSGHFMPADVMADLEAYSGRPIYSQAIRSLRPSAEDVASVVHEACDVGEAAIDLQRLVRMAAGDGELTETEKRDIEVGMQRLEQQVRELRAATDRGQP